MKEFETINIIKFPVEEAWQAMMHHLPELAAEIEDLDSIKQTHKGKTKNGITHLVNEWNAKPQLPKIVLHLIRPGMLSWTDTATWTEDTRTVSWTIESHYFKKDMICTGHTVYESTKRGKECKITFKGSLDIKPGALPIAGGFFSGTVAKTVETVIAQLIPTNFKKIARSLEHFIAKEHKGKR